MYGLDSDSWLLEPHYALICDTYSEPIKQSEDLSQWSSYSPFDNKATHVVDGVPYVAQSEIKLCTTHTPDFRLLNPSTSLFFNGFDERDFKYIMKPWLRKIYPLDV